MAINVATVQADLDANFVQPGLAVGQPPNAAEIGKFDTLTTLEAALPSFINAKDLPYLTVNDKVFAARHKITAWSATSFNIGDVVTHLGSHWYASTAAISTDVPGTAALWKKCAAPYA
jgi:hypothetical protein